MVTLAPVAMRAVLAHSNRMASFLPNARLREVVRPGEGEEGGESAHQAVVRHTAVEARRASNCEAALIEENEEGYQGEEEDLGQADELDAAPVVERGVALAAAHPLLRRNEVNPK